MLLMIKRWLHARLVLGVALAWHVLRLPFRRGNDAKRWLQAMSREGLGATDAVHWRRGAAASRCIGCGRCNVLGSQALPHPSAVMLGAARLQADAPEWLSLVPHLRAIDEDVRALCPTGASPDAVADVLEGHARSLRRLTE